MAETQTTTKPMSTASLLWTAWLLVGVCGPGFGADASYPAVPNARRDDEPVVSTGVMGVRRAFPPDEAGRKAFFQETKDRAEKGDAEAQQDLGGCYYAGLGVAKDAVEGVKWFRRAAEQGNVSAQSNLGRCYKEGEGVSQDYREAVKWYRKAADQGHAEGQGQLGDYYAKGRGVPQDYVEAHKWLNLASSQGFVEARALMSTIEQEMTGQQITDALRLAHEFRLRKASAPGPIRPRDL